MNKTYWKEPNAKGRYEFKDYSMLFVIVEWLVYDLCLKLNCFGEFPDPLTGKFDGKVQIQTPEIKTHLDDNGGPMGIFLHDKQRVR